MTSNLHTHPTYLHDPKIAILPQAEETVSVDRWWFYPEVLGKYIWIRHGFIYCGCDSSGGAYLQTPPTGIWWDEEAAYSKLDVSGTPPTVGDETSNMIWMHCAVDPDSGSTFADTPRTGDYHSCKLMWGAYFRAGVVDEDAGYYIQGIDRVCFPLCRFTPLFHDGTFSGIDIIERIWRGGAMMVPVHRPSNSCPAWHASLCFHMRRDKSSPSQLSQHDDIETF